MLGTVIGVVRPTGTGALMPVRAMARGSFRPTIRDLGRVADRSILTPELPRHQRRSVASAAWWAPCADSQLRGSGLCEDPGIRERIRAGWSLRLSTLLLCHARARNVRLRAALLDEVVHVAGLLDCQVQAEYQLDRPDRPETSTHPRSSGAAGTNYPHAG